MQTFPCPFCGLRNETEFHFAAEAGKVRPHTGSHTASMAASIAASSASTSAASSASAMANPAPIISDADWARYLYNQKNEKGLVREIWMHVTCGEVFVLERDSMTMDVIGSTALREDAV